MEHYAEKNNLQLDDLSLISKMKSDRISFHNISHKMRAEVYDELKLANPDKVDKSSLSLSKDNTEKDIYEDFLQWKFHYISLISTLEDIMSDNPHDTDQVVFNMKDYLNLKRAQLNQNGVPCEDH